LSGPRRSDGPSQPRDTDAAPTQLKTGGWHSIEWPCELAGTFSFLFFGFTTIAVLESSLSPLNQALPSAVLRLVLLGAVFGILAAIVALSPVGRRSGAQHNPAVTIGFWAHGQTHTHDLVGYVAAQCLGAVLAAAFFATSGSWAQTANFARTEPRPELSGWAAAGVEVAVTFGLVLVVLLMVSSPRTVRWTPVGVTVALMVLIPLGGPLTGAGMNPARTLGPDVVSTQYPFLWSTLSAPRSVPS
jgi:aquaporin Z